MTTRSKKRLLRGGAILLLCGAAVAARFCWPCPAASVETWFLGPEGNPVTAALAALEDGMGDGVGQAVAAFCEEFSDDTCT